MDYPSLVTPLQNGNNYFKSSVPEGLWKTVDICEALIQ